ncbi:MAG: type II toxin-antitoxin system prevent-host-death family antitoxin [Coriobacteriales bacterium]|jgi:prevent-host-death family protein|nr:type II toxin-antitoxin system prevent-host-death family antitoxin [Coriobacteriales bacterium]
MTKTVNIYDAKKNLSRIVDDVATGKGDYVICKYGNPRAKIVPIENGQLRPKVGFAKEYFDSMGFVVPDDFDTMMQDEIIALFEGNDK